MSLSLIRAQIKSTLEGVTGIGKVHDYWRRSVNKKTFENLFKTPTDKIHVWLITRTAVQDEVVCNQQAYHRTHSIKIWGFYALQDSTGTAKVFDGIIDLVMDDLRTALKLPGPLNNTAFNATPPQANNIEEGKFGEITSHAVQITFTVTEYIPPT